MKLISAAKQRMMRRDRGFTLAEVGMGVGIIAAIVAACFLVYWLPFILLWCLKSMGIEGVNYSDGAWWGAFWGLILFRGPWVSTSTFKRKKRESS